MPGSGGAFSALGLLLIPHRPHGRVNNLFKVFAESRADGFNVV